MSVTIKDIAEHTGLAISTISKYINGGNVLPENQIKIQEAIEKMNFSVNPFARSMKTNKSYIIGLIISIPNEENTHTLVNAIQRQFMSHGYFCMITTCDNNEESQKKVTNLMLQRNIDGLLFLDMYVHMQEFSQYREKPIPVLAIGKKPENEKCDQIYFDDYTAISSITSYLLTKTSSIAYVGGLENNCYQKKRYDGFINAFKAANITPDESIISFGQSTDDSGYLRTCKLLSGSNPPKALIIADYNITIGSAMAIAKSGILVPDNMNIAVFKVGRFSDNFSHNANLISLPLERVSTVVTKVLLGKIEANQDLYESIQIPYEIEITE